MTDIDLELIKIISNRRRLKAFVRRSSISVDEIESVFTDVITELKNEFGKELEQKRLHDQKIAEFKELLKAENLSLSDFFDVAEQEQKTTRKQKAKPKYEFTDETGTQKQWSGRGIMPKYLRERIEAGASLEDFLIKE
jgi:DNA-binding protein H-NS